MQTRRGYHYTTSDRIVGLADFILILEVAEGDECQLGTTPVTRNYWHPAQIRDRRGMLQGEKRGPMKYFNVDNRVALAGVVVSLTDVDKDGMASNRKPSFE